MNPNIDTPTAHLIKELTENQTRTFNHNGLEFLIGPSDIVAKAIGTAHLPSPPRVKRHITLSDLGEMHLYLGELLSIKSAAYPIIFADYSELKFTLFPEYHTGEKLSWLDHSASVELTHSREFQEWKKKDGVRMSQVEFAEFIDRNVIDITNPPGATMLTMAQTLEATRTEVFKSAVRVSDGTHQFTWANDAADNKGNTIVPEKFNLALRIFQGDDEAVEVTAKLYYRIKDGALNFFYQLHRIDEIIEKLWDEKLIKLREATLTQARVFAGSFAHTNITE